MNQHLHSLQAYPFEKLRALFDGIAPPALSPIALSIGEPKHASPQFVSDAITQNLDKLSNYPTTKGLPALRQAISDWACQRFALPALAPDTQVLPVNGTREALFAFAQTVVNAGPDALVCSPNPFYQIYEGAALLAGAQPEFLACRTENGFIPDFDNVSPSIWQRCQLLFICTPGNPSGAVMSSEELQKLIALADQYDFIIASDECYSELYFNEDQPPPGLLQACAEMNRNDYHRCVVFHSLSKRSNLPGLRSGFVAGDAAILKDFLLYRTYHGCAMPIQHQLASIAAWNDELHVIENRTLYRQKFEEVLSILDGCLDVSMPDASFYLWAKTPITDTDFARGLFAQQHVTVLPGSYLSREVDGFNPGSNYVRMALVAEPEQCAEGARRIKAYVESLQEHNISSNQSC
ncbi:LL-diaminopimelate aminotransferase [Zhongshania aliphaticivorans]|uniref:LL-diaminopimelate aminotransferase n=1 Tax=Zhongshania aliphaticivorans TaxID=1470434 RepID=A0A5S9N8Y0_9GAMM|nr:succinyldiaminopimelate transaminase [Zhongshania aliphaticivorans]CAA0078675.1 LL-diaminopimelate aminotransferase [Zhongshania aliphaticivorans]CAA0086496.1 LL-diaminopimelate aminotransferase [Zhongshania aliphaticivorans]